MRICLAVLLTLEVGVTAILPHQGNLFRAKVPGAMFVGNAFGKVVGSTQIEELGEIETPILLTSTLNVWRVFAAIRNAKTGVIEEGSVGAGTGTVALGFKGGIGTASRKLTNGYTVGVLVETNFGGFLTIGGARNLKRLGARSMLGLARTGASGNNGSGDYAIAFTTSPPANLLNNDAMSPLFLAAIEATEEVVYNSLLRATTITGRGHTVEALPIEKTLEILRRHAVLKN